MGRYYYEDDDDRAPRRVVYVEAPRRKEGDPYVKTMLSLTAILFGILAVVLFGPNLLAIANTPQTTISTTAPRQQFNGGGSAPVVAPAVPTSPPVVVATQAPVAPQPQPQPIVIEVQRQEAPTAMPVPPTDTPQPTATQVPPTNTPIPTATPVPPTATPILPTPTAYCASDGNLYRDGKPIGADQNGGRGCGTVSGGGW